MKRRRGVPITVPLGTEPISAARIALSENDIDPGKVIDWAGDYDMFEATFNNGSEELLVLLTGFEYRVFDEFDMCFLAGAIKGVRYKSYY